MILWFREEILCQSRRVWCWERFEWKAGSTFLNAIFVSLLKAIIIGSDYPTIMHEYLQHDDLFD